jgi:hypothetical protein
MAEDGLSFAAFAFLTLVDTILYSSIAVAGLVFQQ